MYAVITFILLLLDTHLPMTNFTTTYHSRIYKMGKAMLSFLAGLVVQGVVVLLLFKATGSPFVAAFLGYAAPLLCLVFLAGKFRNLFTYDTSIQFDKEGMKLTEFGKDGETIRKEEAINWQDLAGYRFYFGRKGVIQLFLYFRNGKSRTLFFNDEQSEAEAMKERSLFSILYAFITSYNADKDPTQQIIMKGGILKETKGKVMLTLMVFAAIAAIAFELSTNYGRVTFLLTMATVLSCFFVLMVHATAQARLRRLGNSEPLPEDQLAETGDTTSNS